MTIKSVLTAVFLGMACGCTEAPPTTSSATSSNPDMNELQRERERLQAQIDQLERDQAARKQKAEADAIRDQIRQMQEQVEALRKKNDALEKEARLAELKKKDLERARAIAEAQAAAQAAAEADANTTTVVTQDGNVSIVYIQKAPPPLIKERRTIQPGPEYVWVDGYWVWTGTKYVWVAGHWEKPPSSSTVWVKPLFEIIKQLDGKKVYRQKPGHWEPRHHDPRDPRDPHDPHDRP